MSTYLAYKINEKLNTTIYNDLEYETKLELNCSIHGKYIKTVHQILYKSDKCPECTRLARNKKLSEIGKTKIGCLNNFYGHTHTEETINKLKKPVSDKTKKKISKSVSSKECKEKTRQTCLLRYNVEKYSNINKIKETRQKNIELYKNKNNLIEVYNISSIYGYSWINANIVPIIKYKNVLFINKNDIYKIINYTSKITHNAGKSYKEKELVSFIKTFYEGQIYENKRKIIYPKELDIYLPDLKLAIEYNGNYWHSIENNFMPENHLQKSLLCKDKNIRLIHIYEFEDFEQQKQLLKDLILGHDNYNPNDFNKNNFLDVIPELYANKTNKGTVYSIGPCYK